MKSLAFAAASTALITVLVVLGTQHALAATDPIPNLQDCIVIDSAGARQTCTPEPPPPSRDPTDTPPPPPTWTPIPDTATPTQTSTTSASASPRPTETPLRTATPTQREPVAGAGSTAGDGSGPTGAPRDGFLPDLPLSPAATLLLLGLLGLAGVVLLLISSFDYLTRRRRHRQVRTWNFEGAWPVKVTGPSPGKGAAAAQPGQEWFDMDAADPSSPPVGGGPKIQAFTGFNPQPEPPPDPGHEMGHKVSPGEAEGFNPQPEPPADPGHEMGQELSPQDIADKMSADDVSGIQPEPFHEGGAQGASVDDQGRYKPKMPFDQDLGGANEINLQDSAGSELSPDQAAAADHDLGPDDLDLEEDLGSEEGLQ